MKSSSSAAFFHLVCCWRCFDSFLLTVYADDSVSYIDHTWQFKVELTLKKYLLFSGFWDRVLHALRSCHDCFCKPTLPSAPSLCANVLSPRVVNTGLALALSHAAARGRRNNKPGERRSKACTMWSHITVWSSPKQGAHIFQFANKIHNQTQSKRGLV